MVQLTAASRCGLRYARSRAKKEGGTQRRRKDKALNSMSNKSDHSPSASPVNVPYSTMRRGSTYDESTSFTSGGPSLPPPGNDVFGSQQPAGLNGMTPSPSPPSATATGGFVPYNPHPVDTQNNSPASDHRGHPQFAPQFYSIPPPMPGPPQHSMHGGNHPGATLPRLEPMMTSFTSRMPPSMHTPTTPAAGSPLSSHFSYERDKQRDMKERDRPLLSSSPLSAEQRKY